MAECMNFPETPLEFLKLCEFKDEKEIYTNGSMLIPTFRVEQMIEHYFNSTSTAGVQEVVRCKDCIHICLHSSGDFYCSITGTEYKSYELDHYCSYGAKMDKERQK